MIKLTGLWLHSDGIGMSGPLGNGVLKVFKNKYKTETKHPDYILYLDEKQKKEEPVVTSTPHDDDGVPF